MNRIVGGALVSGMLLVLADLAPAATYQIEADGSGDYPTIRAALAAVGSGDEIVLGDGVYAGADNRNLNYLGHAIVIRSASDDPTACVIDAEGMGRGVVSFNAAASPSVLRGVTIRNGFHPTQGGGIYVSTAVELRVENCIVEGSTSIQGGGMMFRSGARVTVVDCIVRDNEAMEGGGIFLSEDTSPRIENTLVVDNRATRLGGGGIWAAVRSSPEIVGSTVSGNRVTGGDGAGIFAHALSHPRLESSIVWGNCGPDGDPLDLHVWDLSSTITVECSVTNLDGLRGEVDRITLGTDVLDVDPLFCDDLAGCGGGASGSVEGYRLADNSPCRASVSPCGVRIGAFDAGGCGVGTPVRDGTWAALKSRFR